MQMAGKKVCDYKEKPLVIGHHSLSDVSYFVACGKLKYRLGWTPLHLFFSIFGDIPYSLGQIFVLGSYFASYLSKPKKLDVADYVWNYQIRSLTSHIRGCVQAVSGRVGFMPVMKNG